MTAIAKLGGGGAYTPPKMTANPCMKCGDFSFHPLAHLSRYCSIGNYLLKPSDDNSILSLEYTFVIENLCISF